MNSGGERYKLLLVVEPAYDASLASGEIVFHHPSLVVLDEVRPDLVGTVCPAVESGRLWERNPAMRRET
jgi:hypothetical protein